jgi:hypothetical protein
MKPQFRASSSLPPLTCKQDDSFCYILTTFANIYIKYRSQSLDFINYKLSLCIFRKAFHTEMEPTFRVYFIGGSGSIVDALQSILKYEENNYDKLGQLPDNVDISRVKVTANFNETLFASQKEGEISFGYFLFLLLFKFLVHYLFVLISFIYFYFSICKNITKYV